MRNAITQTLSSKHFDNAVAAAADHPATAPHDGADTLAAHNAMGRDLLRAGPRLERPEAE